MRALPICVVGAGSIGQRHIEVAERSDRVDLVAVVEPDPGLRAALAERGLPMVADLSEVPAHVRAAVVATPTPAHAPAAQAALERGMAVLVEKPLTGTLAEGRALLAQAEALGLPLYCGHHRRCHPFSIAARDALAEIGAPVGVQALWSLRKHAAYYEPLWRRSPGAGPLMTNLSHELDLLAFFYGEALEVTALTASAVRGLGIEDTAALALRFDSGALGSVLISDAGASPWAFEAASGENPAIALSAEDYMRFCGTEGALAFPSLTRWQASQPGEIEWSKPLARVPGAGFDPIDPLQAQIERFAAVLAGGEDDVLCTGAAGLAALEMTLATALSARDGRPVARGAVPGDFNGS
jgi:predicted dehydrogenase